MASLDGEARGSLTTLRQQGALGNYKAIIRTLNQDFGNQSRAPVHRAELKSRRRKEGESIAELARAFRKLAGMAYPELTFHLQETLAMENFLEALDYDTALAVHQAQCTTLNQAAKVATELEAFRFAERRKHQPRKLARVVAADSGNMENLTQEEPLKKILAEICEVLREVKKPAHPKSREERQIDRSPPRDLSANAANRRPGSGRRDLSTVECWNCGQNGHYRTSCPQS